MTEKSRKYLSDILMAIDLITEFTAEINDFTSYNADRKTQSAVERQLVIIGEALNKLRQNYPEIQIQHNKMIIGFRNRLVHAYDSIDNTIVWAILNRYLENLEQEIKSMY